MIKFPFRYYILLLISVSLISCSDKRPKSQNSDELYDYLKENFKAPPSQYGVNCWWWWLNGNVSKEAIARDLESMKSRNFQGAMIFDAGGHNQRGHKDIPAGPLFGSDEWNKLFVFALDEARRLGLEMGFNIQSGWNLGGPRVTPEYTAKQITYSETKIEGKRKISIKLELPESRRDFYKDIAILAFPLAPAHTSKDLISNLELKLGYHELGGSAPDCRFLLGKVPRNRNIPEDSTTYMVKREEILDLTSLVDSEGGLTWDAPEGDWNIMRIGYTCTNSHVSTSSGEWQGSVLDYMSKEAFDFYWKDVVEPIFKAAGDHVGTTLTYMETDSWECGGMNWTDDFPEEFKQYRGYDIVSYLPVVAGYVIDDINRSNAFLADFRKTLGDLVAYNHYARFSEYAQKYNMGIQPESAGPHAGPMDGIKNYGFSDIVMSEFWSPSPHRPNPENRYFLKQASSAAHIYGKKIVGAESFTTIGPQWNDELWHDQKSAFDHEICAGLNRLYFHTFTCSPPEMGLPGQEYFAGTHVNPQVTWWNQSGAFIDYMHRTQLLVQEGNFVADVLYYYGDHVPNVFPFKHSDPAGVLPGFDYDVTDETIFLDLEIIDGKLRVPGGVEYRLLVLPDHKVLSMAVLKKVEELLQQGALIIGHKPERSVSLVGGIESKKQFSALADKIWGNNLLERGEKQYGKGRICWGISAREYLLSEGLHPDFNVLESDSKTDWDYIHYTIGQGDLYFVTNQSTERQIIDCQFRVSGKQPELWDALTGEIREALAFTQKDGLTTVPLTLEPYGAVLVVFNNQIDKNQRGAAQRNYTDYKTVLNIEGAWDVNFDPQWGGPASVTFPELLDWSTHPDEGIKYYSGPALYNKTFHLDFDPQEEEQYFLQLESVKDVGIAEVKINGKDKGIVWTKPFRVDISKELQKGDNSLEIIVINSWFNRVAGDEIFPDRKSYTSTNIVLINDFRGNAREEIPLEPSGLLGPVTIQKAVKPIDRKALVERHNIIFTEVKPAEIPQVGNGEIAFGIDVTGLQTLSGNTISQWGWHTSPLPEGKRIEDFKMYEVEVHGHTATYPVSQEGQKELYGWLRENPHRLNLGKLSFMLDDRRVEANQLTEIHQELDLWNGTITSNYSLDGVEVKVVTSCHPELDMLAVQVHSPLVKEKRLSVQIAFPYGHATNHNGADWDAMDLHSTELVLDGPSALFKRTLDEDHYEAYMAWDGKASVRELSRHNYAINPSGHGKDFSFVIQFSPNSAGEQNANFQKTLKASSVHWQTFWNTGGAIDLSESKDVRWKELERRVVLSQYLLAVNEAGSLPPQESGLVNNSGWYGKFHLEMHWWHGAHYQLWDRFSLFDKSLGWYQDILPEAKYIAKRQGYHGARWPKMIGPDGRFGPSAIGPWLIWQQPHPIFYAEQNYRLSPTRATLEKWKEVVFESADFMASYAYENELTGKYDLGPWVINAAENNRSTKQKTINPAFELAYWRYGLKVACDWRERLGLPENKEWLRVRDNLAPLPVEEGVYVMYQGVNEMWALFNNSHIDVIGTGAFLPGEGVDLDILGHTIEKVFKEWDMPSTWGWDFPWLAMASARAGKPHHAVDALLMDIGKNAYSLCGINKGGPAATYFPGNGGLLYAVAMMAAGWDGAPEKHAPGFPDDGSWVVRYEGLKKAQ